ncbi:MAG: hypothetical protein UV54_C0018G0003 [Candidatus Beckwithbacteria bacterium GW2011_GWA2_43_10]|uniref:Uncharacterized protein n=1 Tax=Candidatus Beckwithbacteria bacterium GW2011_GWA2_43_10 TaxID=1618369 RepID=A0A0G1EZI4_9BACT|nr:MAG: hypothetical protein UV54_C0018G0003 [Candidatus Beckwithbacteria bacterium GW2011_GWA2_43_10]
MGKETKKWKSQSDWTDEDWDKYEQGLREAEKERRLTFAKMRFTQNAPANALEMAQDEKKSGAKAIIHERDASVLMPVNLDGVLVFTDILPTQAEMPPDKHHKLNVSQYIFEQTMFAYGYAPWDPVELVADRYGLKKEDIANFINYHAPKFYAKVFKKGEI